MVKEEIWQWWEKAILKVWITVSIGVTAPLTLFGKLIKVGVHFDEDVRQVISEVNTEFVAATTAKDVKLARLRVGDLGFRERPTLLQIIEQAAKIGLTPCSLAMVLHLSLALVQEKSPLCLYVIIREKSKPEGSWMYSILPNNKVNELCVHTDNPDHKWDLDTELVWVIED